MILWLVNINTTHGHGLVNINASHESVNINTIQRLVNINTIYIYLPSPFINTIYSFKHKHDSPLQNYQSRWLSSPLLTVHILTCIMSSGNLPVILIHMYWSMKSNTGNVLPFNYQFPRKGNIHFSFVLDVMMNRNNGKCFSDFFFM